MKLIWERERGCVNLYAIFKKGFYKVRTTNEYLDQVNTLCKDKNVVNENGGNIYQNLSYKFRT